MGTRDQLRRRVSQFVDAVVNWKLVSKPDADGDGPQSDNEGEQMGFVVHPAARMPVTLILTVFFAPYLVKLAKFAADENDQVYWMGFAIAPMGYVSSFTFLSTFCVSALAPLIGSISDHLPARRDLFKNFTMLGVFATYSALLVCYPSFWWVGGLIVTMITVSYQLSVLMLSAYLPEIANDEKVRTKISAHATIFGNAGQLVALIFGIGIALSLGSSDISLKEGSFETMQPDSTVWMYRNVGVDRMPSSNSNELYCNSEAYSCLPVALEGARDKNFALKIQSDGSPMAVFQGIELKNPSDFIKKNIMTTVWVRSESQEPVAASLRIWIDGVVSESTKFVSSEWTLLRSDAQFGEFLSKDLFVEVVSPKGITLFVDKFELTAQPDFLPPLFVMCAGAVWHYVSLLVHHNLKPRPASHPLPPGSSYLKAGLRQLYSTLVRVRQKPMLLRFLLSVACYSAVNQAAYPSLTVFLSEELKFGTAEVGLVFVEAQVVGILGALMTIKLGSHFGYLRTYCIALTGYLTGLLLICSMISKETAYLVWPMVAFIAAFTASCAVLVRSLYASMIPEKQEAEYTGLMYFFEWAFAWTGSLVFSIAYKLTGDMSQALSSLTILGGVALALALSLDSSVFVIRK